MKSATSPPRIPGASHSPLRSSHIPVLLPVALAALLMLSASGGASAATAPPFIVIGFVGGFVRHDDPVHSTVQLAARLRRAYPAGVDVETFDSHHVRAALDYVVRQLEKNNDGSLTADEKQNARIIIYGHSWGAAATVSLARELAADNIPVLLTVQVDSVTRFNNDDAVIPPNVLQAANFYQSSGLIHGRNRIRAADPKRTSILGNFRFDYKDTPYTCNEYPWYDRVFTRAHTQMECDPKVWQQVESLVRSDLPASTAGKLKP